MKMKKLTVLAVTAALSIGSVMTSSAAWVQDGSNWRYQNSNGTYQAGTWLQDGGVWYHFDPMGVMQTGWFKDTNGKWYFFNYNGAMQTGLIMVNNNVYFMNPGGDLFVGEKVINGVSYNFTENGTTNGKPSVSPAMTFGSNGNQTLNYGHAYGGGASSGGSSGGSRPSGTTQASNQAELDAALAAGSTSIRFATDDSTRIVIPAGNYSGTTLTVKAPNATIENNGKFASINIESVAENTWIENIANNIINLYGNAHVDNQSGSQIEVKVVMESINVRLDGSQVKLSVSKPGSTVTSDAPVIANIASNVTLAVSDSAAGESSVVISKKATVDVKSLGAVSTKLEIKVEAANVTLNTAVPSAIIVATTSKVEVVLTSDAAAKDTSMSTEDATFNDALKESANDLINKTTEDTNITIEPSGEDPVDIPSDAKATTQEVVNQMVDDALLTAAAQPYVASAGRNGIAITVKLTGVTEVRKAKDAAESIKAMFDIGGNGIVESVMIDGESVESIELVDLAKKLGITDGSVAMQDVPGKVGRSVKVIVTARDKADGSKDFEYSVTVTK